MVNATQLKSEREEKQRLALEVQKKEQEKQSIIEETKLAVVFKECFTSSSTNILIGDLAKLITQNGYKIGEIIVIWTHIMLQESRLYTRNSLCSINRRMIVCF